MEGSVSGEKQRSLLWRMSVIGPDPVEQGEPRGALEGLLSWPVRCLLVAGTLVAAWAWRDSGVGLQVATGLQYGAVALLAIVISFWWPLLLVNAVAAGLWLVRWRGTMLHLVTFANRQLGHFEAMFVWTVVWLATSADLPIQLGGLASVLLLAEPLVNGLARTSLRFLGSDAPSKSSGDLLWRRRILIYLATAAGLLWIVVRAPEQAARIAPFGLAIGVGLGLRTARHLMRSQRGGDAGPAFRKTQAAVARRWDGGVPLLVLAGVAGTVALSFWQRGKLDAELARRLDGAALPADHCELEDGGPVSTALSLLVLADMQTHELDGARFPGQTELANALNSTASRPAALDVLSAVPVLRFATIFAELARARPAGRPLYWTHLGDLADLGCDGELDRALSLLEALGPGAAAGIAIGNHDMSFQGSFHWSPYWSDACPSGLLGRDDARLAVEARFGARLRDGGRLARLPGAWWRPYGGALVGVRPLGEARHERRRRGVIGVFLDTSDGRAFDWGMPGSVGALSDEQLALARRAVAEVRAEAGPAYATDPAYLLFSHIPVEALAGTSRARLDAFVRDLDGDAPRVLATIAGHTHAAGAHRNCLGRRVVRELIVGSTTDAPQQAGLIDVGSDARGRLALRLRALHAVERPAQTCDGEAHVAASECRRIVAELADRPACAALLGERDRGAEPRDCGEIERRRSLGERLSPLRTFRGPMEGDERREVEEASAAQLLECVCRDGACEVPRKPFAGEIYARLVAQAFARPERRDELSCLAWAASVTQAHEAAGMTMAEALRCSFDDPTLAAEHVAVATLEDVPCW